MNTQPVLEVEDLTVHFPTGRRGETVKAVDGVSFAVQRGETFGIIGESGSGKSTLGRALVCLTRPTGGRLLHRGQDPYALSRAALRTHRRGFQIVFQDPNAALDPRMTIGASIREPLDIAAEGSMAQRTARIRHLLDCVGLRAETEARYPHELSGGQKQRVNIARALALQPAVMVCDEVVAALDASIQADVLNLFADLQQEFDLTYVFITHDLGVVSHVSDRIAVMYLGRLMELGPADAVTDAPLHPYTQALLSSEPEPLPTSLRTARRIHLQGEIPSPIDPPSGCRFRTRCPIATDRCALETPAWRALRPGHLVACHYAELLPEASAQARTALPQEQGN
jgi:peptide/nickel transport system ATP-binding protein/oligopeptide transport system ATP-binding protein